MFLFNQRKILHFLRVALWKQCQKNMSRRFQWYFENDNCVISESYTASSIYFYHITVNRFNYKYNITTKNKSLIPLDLNIIIGSYKFSLQPTIDHHGNSIHCGHYTASVNCCGKTFYCNDGRITECNTIDTRNSSTVYILLYKLIVDCPWPDRGGWESIHASRVQ